MTTDPEYNNLPRNVEIQGTSGNKFELNWIELY